METETLNFAKQHISLKDCSREDASKSGMRVAPTVPFEVNFECLNQSRRQYQVIHSYPMPQNQYINEEPIDLTTFDKQIRGSDTPKFETPSISYFTGPQDGLVTDQQNDYHPKRKRKRRKFAYTTDGKLVLVPNEESLQSPASFSESKQLEILKAAKSLFSKRTRTLYHWMYPQAAKQQIKIAVTSSWESLGAQEKDFYISQVLGRFGFPQCSLMINPQLGGIKELPPISVAPEVKAKSRELQSAISSIMPENPMPPGLGNSALTFEEFEEFNELTKKRRGRPPGSSNKKHKFDLSTGNLSQDFKDDPELSQELEQFATMFNLSKI